MAIVTDSQSNILNSSSISINEFTIKADAAMFAVLTQRVYTDLISAPIREWSTNAVDACIAANLPINFDVHLPTLTQPTFSVRDYGTGLAPDDILGLFTVLGESSKRNSNLYNGQFGLGRLSGLAYSTSFTVDSYHNGEHHSYIISMQEGIPIAAHLSSSLSDVPNGLRLSLPVRPSDISSFHSKATRIFQYFTPRPNFNVDVVFNDSKLLYISDEFLIDGQLSGYRENFILMGNVLYRIPTNTEDLGISKLVITAPIGSVSINPGRESLSMTDSTTTYINEAFARAHTAINLYASNAVTSQSTDYARLKAFSLVESSLPYDLRTKLSIPIPITTYGALLFTTGTSYLKESTSIMIRLPLNLRFFQAGSFRSYDCNSRNTNISTFCNSYFLVLDNTAQIAEAVKAFRSTLPNNAQIITVSRQSGSKLPEFTSLATTILTDLGISFTLVSSLLAGRAKAVITTARESGVYVCNGHLNCGDTLMFEGGVIANNSTTYYYFELTGFTPTDERALAIAQAYHSLPSTATSSSKLVGVQKKYLSDIQQLPAFIPVFDFVQSYFTSNHLTVIDEVYDSAYLSYTALPSICPSMYKVFITEYLERSDLRRKWYVTSTIFEQFSSTFTIPHTYHKLTHSQSDTEKKYPLLTTMQSHYADQQKLEYYMQLEAYRECTSNTNDQRGHPIHST